LSAIISWLKVAKANKVASLAADLTQQEIKEIKEKLLKESVEEVVEKSKKETKEKLDEITEKARNKGKLTIKNEGEITISKFNKIAKRIKIKYDVDMFLIDRNNKPLHAFWTDQPLKSKNYSGIQLEGPAIYLFREQSKNAIYKITSYTIQHELFHMKMWLIIKDRFPNNFIKKFHQITDEIHEMYVISEFIKSKQFTKWNDIDIINDIDNINFKKSMKLKTLI